VYLAEPTPNSKYPSIKAASGKLVSNGYNVIQGTVSTAWTQQGSDLYFDPATMAAVTGNIVKLVGDKYKVVFAGGKGKAYRHLSCDRDQATHRLRRQSDAEHL
jgi:hypothetical protein